MGKSEIEVYAHNIVFFFFLTTNALLSKHILGKYAKNLFSVCVKLAASVFLVILTDDAVKLLFSSC